jgi:hypothetical protein
MTPSAIIADARILIQDTRSPQRYSDSALLSFVNQTIRRMVMLRPDLFITVGDITPAANVSEQLLPSTAIRLVEIFRVKNGAAIEEVDRDVFDRAYPQWTTDTAGTPTKYIRHPRNPRGYFLYPRPTSSIVLVGEYVDTPPTYAIGDTISVLPAAYYPAIVDGTVYLAESIDNEHVNANRAKLFYDSFTQSLGVALQSRDLIDNETGGARMQQGTSR